MQSPEPLSAVFAAVGARLASESAAPRAPPGRHTRDALDAYCRVPGEMEPVAREVMASLLPCVLRDTAEARAAMRDDPAAPGLGRAYGSLLAELSDLAAVFALGEAAPGADTEAYQAVCAEIRGLMAAAAAAEPAWELMRQSRVAYAASRSRPPPRAAPRAPLADDVEYYA